MRHRASRGGTAVISQHPPPRAQGCNAAGRIVALDGARSDRLGPSVPRFLRRRRWSSEAAAVEAMPWTHPVPLGCSPGRRPVLFLRSRPPGVGPIGGLFA